MVGDIIPYLVLVAKLSLFSPGMMKGSSASSSSCTVTYVGGTVSVSCVDLTSSGYQVILLQDNDLTVINVGPGEKQTVPVVPSGRYCIMEVPMGGEFDLGVKYSRELTAEETTTPPSVIGIASKLVSSLLVCIDIMEVNQGEYMLS